MKKTTKDEQIKLLTDACFSYQDQIKTIDKNWEERQRVITYALDTTRAELSDIYKQIALIYLSEKKPYKVIPF